ncbi:MAG TPA: DUF6538 domain-containing protein [Microvirga sp.]|jgi:hypothetical protein
MTYVNKRPDSSLCQFRMRVPRDVLALVKGRHVPILFPAFRADPALAVTAKIGSEVKFSLQTRDETVACARDRIARAHLDRVFDAARSTRQHLTHKQLVALSGEVYRNYVQIFEDEPGAPDDWAAHKAVNRAVLEGRVEAAPSIHFGTVADRDLAAVRFGSNLTEGVNALPRRETPTALEQRFGLLADWVLALHGIDIDGPTRQRLLGQVGSAVMDAS